MNEAIFTKKFIIKTVILSVLIAFIFTGLYAGIKYYLEIPEKAIIYVPGDTYSISRNVETKEDASIHKVTAKIIPVLDKMDFIKEMWDSKQFYPTYVWYNYESEQEVMVTAVDIKIESNKSDLGKYEAFEKYVINRYGEDEAEKFFTPIKIDEEMSGNSDSLAIMLALIAVYEEKNWLHSNKNIVITGNIDEHGNILPVGAVDLKAITAENRDADVFIVPAQQYDEVFKFIGEKTPMKVLPVKHITETIEWLDSNIQ